MLARCLRSTVDDITTFNGNSHTIKWQSVGVQQSQWFSSYTFFKHTKSRARCLKHKEIINISFQIGPFHEDPEWFQVSLKEVEWF